MEKAIDIKRRAQRHIQGGDLEGALREYQKLVTLDDCDPYNFVLLADLLFKRGDPEDARHRYFSAADAYEKTGLYKNAIAVCKKMMRLSLAPAEVLDRLAHLHVLDGLKTEAALYYQQLAEHFVRQHKPREAATVLRKAFQATPDEVRLLDRVAETRLLDGDTEGAAEALAEAAYHYRRQGMSEVAARCQEQAEELKPGVSRESEVRLLLDSGAVPAPPEAVEGQGEAWGGPPLLPSLRVEEDLGGVQEDRGTEGPISEEDSQFERFPSAGGAAGEAVGLRFGVPAAEAAGGADGAPAASRLLSAAEIEAVLARAQERLRSSDQEGAAQLLLEAAQAYESVGRHENASTIFRTLSRSPAATDPMLKLWLANCESRRDHREAAQVACELGDRALQAGAQRSAREWFERARRLDEGNSHAERRLRRLSEMDAAPALDPAPEAPTMVPVEAPPGFGAMPDPVGPWEAPEDARSSAAVAGPAPRGDRIELALGRSEAVTFDLGAVLSEFQRGVEVQLSGDPRAHYDLAVAYREMGLLEQAVQSFRVALESPALAAAAAEMIGHCLLEQGCFEEATTEIRTALERPGLDPDAVLGLRYLLGLALETGGRPEEALVEFERVFTQQSSYRDVAAKLRSLRKTLEGS